VKRVALYLLAALTACSSNRAAPSDAPAVPDAMHRDGAPPSDDAAPSDVAMDRPQPLLLMVSSLGVALSSFPGRSTLTRTLDVRASQMRTDITWTATADQSWLSVTPGGMSGGSLTLTANPSGLAADQLYIANVKVSSPNTAVQNEQDLRVGLWIGSADPTDVTLNVAAFIPNIVADPVQPIFYTNSAGTDITLYNAYSAAVTRTFSSAVGGAGTMAISSDGAILFVDDLRNRRVVALDTRTGGQLQVYPWDTSVSNGVAYVRPSAHPILLIGAGKAFEVDTAVPRGSTLGGPVVNGGAWFAIDPANQNVYIQEQGDEPSSVAQYAIAYNALGANPLITELRTSSVRLTNGSFGEGICVSADGARLYVANRSSNSFAVRSTRGLTALPDLPFAGMGFAFGENIACGWNGLFYGSANSVGAYRADGSIATSFNVAADASTMVLSGDNTRITGSVRPPFGTIRPPTLSIVNTPNL
jgi:hypothetical protein